MQSLVDEPMLDDLFAYYPTPYFANSCWVGSNNKIYHIGDNLTSREYQTFRRYNFPVHNLTDFCRMDNVMWMQHVNFEREQQCAKHDSNDCIWDASTVVFNLDDNEEQ